MTVSFGWGPAEARALTGPDPGGAARAACVVVVDVLSFTTAVGVAVEAGSAVHPYRWRDASAATYAREKDAVLAVLRAACPDLTLTPEATAAATLWTAIKDPVAALRGRASGRELYAYGCPQDVEVAAENDTSTTVPVLVDGAFQEAP
ncbi:2-phosphosulfolactate phosphatase [Streptomyces laurentii]|uniref:2-phosphosulfolactate phosphatase n=1 Tax=Streptomyces laurentii TaxID=39478 RepID=UPI00369057C2